MEKSKSRKLEKVDESINEDDSDSLRPSDHKDKLASFESGSRAQVSDASESQEKDNQYEFIMGVLRPYKKVLYYLIKNGFIKEKTSFCKHSIKSCYLNSIEGFCRNFFYGFMTKAAINLLLGMLSPRKRLLRNIVDLFSSD
jgi:hypothetical protein